MWGAAPCTCAQCVLWSLSMAMSMTPLWICPDSCTTGGTSIHPGSRTPGLKVEACAISIQLLLIIHSNTCWVFHLPKWKADFGRCMLGVPPAKPLGLHCDTSVCRDGDILDVDNVSKTFLFSNVHTVRHNCIHLNRCAATASGFGYS